MVCVCVCVETSVCVCEAVHLSLFFYKTPQLPLQNQIVCVFKSVCV